MTVNLEQLDYIYISHFSQNTNFNEDRNDRSANLNSKSRYMYQIYNDIYAGVLNFTLRIFSVYGRAWSLVCIFVDTTTFFLNRNWIIFVTKPNF